MAVRDKPQFVVSDPPGIKDGSEEPPEAPTERKEPESEDKPFSARLEEVGVTKEDLEAILDSLLTKGRYTREYDIAGKIKVVFRARDGDDGERLRSRLDEEAPRYTITQQELIAKYNLASSLMRYGETKFMDVKNDKDFETALAYVNKLPGAVLNILLQRLFHFDSLVLLATSVENVGNF